MELAALPGDTGQTRADGGLEAGMIVADKGFDSVKAAVLQTFQELTPVDLGFGEFAGNAEQVRLP